MLLLEITTARLSRRDTKSYPGTLLPVLHTLALERVSKNTHTPLTMGVGSLPMASPLFPPTDTHTQPSMFDFCSFRCTASAAVTTPTPVRTLRVVLSPAAVSARAVVAGVVVGGGAVAVS